MTKPQLIGLDSGIHNSVFATNTSFVGDFAQGVFSVQTAGMPATLAGSQLTNQVSLGKQYLQFDNT